MARVAAILPILLVLLALGGCGRSGPPPSAPTPTLSTGEVLPFESILRGTQGLCIRFDPEVRSYFATGPEQLDAAFRAIFGTGTSYPHLKALYAELTGTDFDTHAIVALHRQCKAHGGYEIVIENVVLHDDQSVSVYAELWDPSGYVAVADAEMSYLHIVRIPWTGADEPAIDVVGYELIGKPPREPVIMDSIDISAFESPIDHVSVMKGDDITDPGPWTYVSGRAGYSIDYPVGWNVIERREGKAGSISFDGSHGDFVSLQYMTLEKPEDEDLIEWLTRVDTSGPGPGTPKGYTPVELAVEGTRGESQQAEMIYTIRAPGYGFFITNGRLVLELFTHTQNDALKPLMRTMADSITFAEDAPSSLSELQPPDEALRYTTLDEYHDFLDSYPHVRTPTEGRSTWTSDSPLSPSIDTAEIVPTSTPASSSPIPADQQDWFVYRGLNRPGLAYPDWEIRYDPDTWDLRFTKNGSVQNLFHRDIPNCSIKLYAGRMENQPLARTYLAGTEWEISYIEDSIVHYSTWFGDTGYFFDLSLPEPYSTSSKSQCQVDAESVFNTLSQVQKAHEKPMYDSQGRRRVVIDSGHGAEYPPFEVWYDEAIWEFEDHKNPRGRGGVLFSPTDSWCRLDLSGWSGSGPISGTTTVANREWDLLPGPEPSTEMYSYGNGELRYTVLVELSEGETYRGVDKSLCQQQIEDVLATFKILY